MKIIKRNGSEMIFDPSKITAAIVKANDEVVETERLTDEEIDNVTHNVIYRCEKMNRA
ncbi:MAG: ATP cone domain-containing protein, partial [Coprobacillus sp.]